MATNSPYRGLSLQTAKGLKELDEGGPTPAPAAAPASSPVTFTKGFTPEQRAKQQKALVEALRRRAAE